jgi:hypothetical protein
MRLASSAGTCCTVASKRRAVSRARARFSSAIVPSNSSADRRLRLRRPRFCRNETFLVLAALLLMAAAGCEHKNSETHLQRAGRQAAQLANITRVQAPEEDRPGQLCSDFGETRVCYEADGARSVARSIPAGVAPQLGFRCGGQGSARTCEDRAIDSGAFDCGTTRCLQLSPRMPDDGEWECVEMSGLPYCHSRGPMAGAERGARALGWLCGARRGDSGEEICLDTDPDHPPDPRFRHCRYEQRLGASVRVCSAAPAALIGDACSESASCPKHSSCQAGLCVPRRPDPACWLDADCGAEAHCALGSCVASGA